jgi:hypothetical protein
MKQESQSSVFDVPQGQAYYYTCCLTERRPNDLPYDVATRTAMPVTVSFIIDFSWSIHNSSTRRRVVGLPQTRFIGPASLHLLRNYLTSEMTNSQTKLDSLASLSDSEVYDVYSSSYKGL